MVPNLPIGFELGVEITYPIDESYSAGLMMSCGQVLGFIYVRYMPNSIRLYHAAT